MVWTWMLWELDALGPERSHCLDMDLGTNATRLPAPQEHYHGLDMDSLNPKP